MIKKNFCLNLYTTKLDHEFKVLVPLKFVTQNGMIKPSWNQKWRIERISLIDNELVTGGNIDKVQ